jgi:transposase
MEKLSLRRGDMVEFMREYQAAEDSNVIFDGTSMLSTSKDNPYCEKGYTPGKKNKTQIRLIYAFELNTRRPIYFNAVPGSISDMTAMITSYSELGLKNCALLLDNRFFSDANIKLMLSSENIQFIIPLKDNTKLVDAEYKPFNAYKDIIESCFIYHNRLIYYRELECSKYPGCKICVYYDERRNKDLENERIKKAQRQHNGNMPKEAIFQLRKEFAMLGVTMLITNKASDAEIIYLDFKSRWNIEEMFDTMKNTLSFNMNYEVKYETQMGWSFIEFISLLMYYEINRVIIDTGLYKNYDVGDILFDLKSIEQSNCNVGGEWKLANLTKRRKELLETMGITLEPISKPPDFSLPN